VGFHTLFSRSARNAARWAGKSGAFVGAVGIIAFWAALGPVFHFSDTWQLVINTGTTIITFLMVFLIQHAQNTESLAVQLKLDELIRAVARAENTMIDIEELEDAELEALQRRYQAAAEQARERLHHRKKGRAQHG
jgi:low affinity Fe/Cu permease